MKKVVRTARGETRALVGGFFEFISQYGVVPLAIGVVIGTAVNDLVRTIVDGLLTPLISLVTPTANLQKFQVTVNGTVFKFGAVLNSTLSFLLVCLVIYVVVKLLLRREEYLKKK